MKIRIEKRGRLWIGILSLILGLIVVFNSFTITGMAVLQGSGIAVGIWKMIAIVMVVGGLIVMNSGDLEKKIEVYDTSHGKNKEESRVYTMIDPYGKRVTLGEFRTMIEEFRKERGGDELVKMAREEYAELLLEKTRGGDEEKAKVARRFLEVLGVNPEEKDYHLTAEEKRELITAFHEWKGEPSARQREVMKKHSLYYEGKGSGKHPKIGCIGTGYSYPVSLTPSEVRGSMNMIHEIMKMMEKARKEGKKSD